LNVETEIAELCAFHKGLERCAEEKNGLIAIKGVLSFVASYKGLESIQDWLEVELRIPKEYPEIPPEVTELQGKVVSNYEHLNHDGTFCLAVPIAAKLAFKKEPNLRGFVNKLVISYLYSYCYWLRHGEYPFDDSPHGLSGFVDYYEKQFGTGLSPELFSGIEKIVKYGYRGHHLCPCGSGKIVRNCHKQVVMDLSQEEVRRQLAHEVEAIKEVVSRASRS
tara:strand:+ start:63 stop:725 length:663 start_codon:yes stop_codon:yes gene_type:complete